MVGGTGQYHRQLLGAQVVPLIQGGHSPEALAAAAEAIQNLNSLLMEGHSTEMVQTVAYLAQAKV